MFNHDFTSEIIHYPGYLKGQKVANTVKHAVDTTFDAYRTEFPLADVSEAPIAKRRKLKKDSSKDGSSSTEGEMQFNSYFVFQLTNV